MTKGKKKENKEETEVKIYESKVKVISYPPSLKHLPSNLYCIYFEKLSIFTLFKANLEDKTKLELPILILQVYDIKSITFRVANAEDHIIISLVEEPDISLTLSFVNVDIKNYIGHTINKKIKATSEKEPIRYSLVEWQYKIAKILEKKYFHLFKDKYNYKNYLMLESLSAFSSIYNINDPLYEYMYNRFFMGMCSIGSKKGKITSKEF